MKKSREKNTLRTKRRCVSEHPRVGHSHTLSETIRRFYRGTPPVHSVPLALRRWAPNRTGSCEPAAGGAVLSLSLSCFVFLACPEFPSFACTRTLPVTLINARHGFVIRNRVRLIRFSRIYRASSFFLVSLAFVLEFYAGWSPLWIGIYDRLCL